MTHRLKVHEGRIGIVNIDARMPFRFGVVTIEKVASATLALDVSVNGTRLTGYASDLLAYKWFDKRPEKTPQDNVTDLIGVCGDAIAAASAMQAANPFENWRALDAEIHDRAIAAGFNHLGASFGVSMVERAMIDALGRALGKPFFNLVVDNDLALAPETVFDELAGMTVAEALPAVPAADIGLRHTVGLADPIFADEIAPADRRGDGAPETLEDYIAHDNLSYLKVKIGGTLEEDRERLARMSRLIEATGRDIAITLDGNEQFADIDAFAGYLETIRASEAVARLLGRTLFIEQPVTRDAAMAGPIDAAALATIGLPMLIDEADGWTTAFHEAMALGYRGVSHKNCKGVIHSLLNAMLIARRNSEAGAGHYFQSAEDLSCLPIVSLNADLAVVATLGIGHVERNGHHYFGGLGHLTPAEIECAVGHHADLYRSEADGARLVTETGRLHIASLQVPGLGTACAPDLDAMTPAAQWDPATLAARAD
ncbi:MULTISPECIES: mandelate racemase [unclassified Roseitalea]|uniref:mandelate racemase n=1 Tax=unclassified Roseitalea TaxID=2639107 RepID=UPI00273F91A7|nr:MULTISPECIES: mandelate racemase [unclassified Roseitalea]